MITMINHVEQTSELAIQKHFNACRDIFLFVIHAQHLGKIKKASKQTFHRGLSLITVGHLAVMKRYNFSSTQIRQCIKNIKQAYKKSHANEPGEWMNKLISSTFMCNLGIKLHLLVALWVHRSIMSDWQSVITVFCNCVSPQSGTWGFSAEAVVRERCQESSLSNHFVCQLWQFHCMVGQKKNKVDWHMTHDEHTRPWWTSLREGKVKDCKFKCENIRFEKR